MHPRLGSGCEVRVRGYARSAQAGELLHDLVDLAAPTHIYPDPAQFCRRTVNADACGHAVQSPGRDLVEINGMFG